MVTNFYHLILYLMLVLIVFIVLNYFVLDNGYSSSNNFPDSEKNNVYDYIIIGAGAAGSVVAARLAEITSNRILVLELGQDNTINSTTISKYDKEITYIPINDGIYLRRYHNDPSRKICNGLEASPCLSDFVTVKQKQRYMAYPRGNGAGGSTGHHSMYDGRGCPRVYDRIAKEVGDDVWSYKNILPYYIKMENYHVKNANPEIHGNKGWLQITKNGRLDQDLKQEMIQVFVDDLGIPFRHDPADPDQVSGVYVSEEQVGLDGLRSNAFKDLLTPMIETQNNITVLFNTLVGKILFDESGSKPRAIGVEAYEKPYINLNNVSGNQVVEGLDGCHAIIPDKTLPPPSRFYARKEVILCGGAMCTPQVLMLSGIGPRKHLEENNIKTMVDLPGVGQNVLDHPFCTSCYELDPKKIIWEWQATELIKKPEYKKNKSPEIIRNIEKYANPQSKYNNAMGLGWDFSSGIPPVDILEPDIHVQIANRFFFDPNCNFNKFPKGDTYLQMEHSHDSYMPNPERPLDFSDAIPGLKPMYIDSQTDPLNPRVFLSFLPELLKIESYGSIRLRNNDPREPIIIDTAYYKSKDAVRRIAMAVMKIREFMSQPGMKRYLKDPNNSEIWPGKNCPTLESVMKFYENWQVFGYHMAGTAKMGSASDQMAVLDSKLRVRGVDGLRVVDMCVYPTPHLHAYNTSRGAYLIAEVASDIIKYNK